MKNMGPTKPIIVKSDDKDLIEVSKIFLKDLEEQFNKKNKDNEKNEKELGKYIGNENYIFTPEIITKKSTLTLIDAPWGTGKTYFIENLLKLMIDEKINSSVFKKMIIVDAWKFSSSTDVSLEFIHELALKLIPTNTKDNILKATVSKFLSSLTFSLNLGPFGIEFSKEEKQKAEKIFKKIRENKEPTIIFIDNIERLGSHSWDLLKSIIKLQEFSNFLIVLPLNLSKLENNEKGQGEYPIEKYVDFYYYKFGQDYDNYFKKHFGNIPWLMKNLNYIFNGGIDGKKLSIREVEKLFKIHKILNMNDDYKILKIIKNKIWHPTSIFEAVGKGYLESFLELEILKRDMLSRIHFEFKKNIRGNSVYISPAKRIGILYEPVPNKSELFNYQIDKNYIEFLNTIENDVKARKIELKNEIKKWEEEIRLEKINRNFSNKISFLEGKKKLSKELLEQITFDMKNEIIKYNNIVKQNNLSKSMFSNIYNVLLNEGEGFLRVFNKYTNPADIRVFDFLIKDMF